MLELFSAVVSQVMSLVKSLLSRLDLTGCKEDVEVVFLSLGGSSLFLVPFFAWLIPVGAKFGPAVFVVCGNHPCLPPVNLALPEDPRRDSACC